MLFGMFISFIVFYTFRLPLYTWWKKPDLLSNLDPIILIFFHKHANCSEVTNSSTPLSLSIPPSPHSRYEPPHSLKKGISLSKLLQSATRTRVSSHPSNTETYFERVDSKTMKWTFQWSKLLQSVTLTRVFINPISDLLVHLATLRCRQRGDALFEKVDSTRVNLRRKKAEKMNISLR